MSRRESKILEELRNTPPTKTVSAFCIVPTADEFLPGHTMALLVNNRRELVGHNRKGDPIWGKYEGIGMPGGGVKDSETLADAVRRETRDETGIPVWVSEEPILSQKKLIISDKYTKEMLYWQYIYDDQSIWHIVENKVKQRRLNAHRLEILINPIHTFIGRPRGWRTSLLREKILDAIEHSRMLERDILEKGVVINFPEPTANSSEVRKLDIREYEEEIKGIVLCPIQRLMQLLDNVDAGGNPVIETTESDLENKNLVVIPGEVPEQEIRVYRGRVKYYYLHLERIRLAIEKARKQGVAMLSYDDSDWEDEEPHPAVQASTVR